MHSAVASFSSDLSWRLMRSSLAMTRRAKLISGPNELVGEKGKKTISPHVLTPYCDVGSGPGGMVNAKLTQTFLSNLR